MKKHLFFIFILLFMWALPMAAQQDSCIQKLASFARNINNFNQLYPREKAYLHVDNTGYYLGETIWFKAYVVTATFNVPTALSKVLYVELLTPEGNIVECKKLKIEAGQCHGAFQLKDSLYAGFYEIRAYTRCMLNVGEDAIFSRVFPVYDKPPKEGQYASRSMHQRPGSQWVHNLRTQNPSLKKVNLSFYPEGGQLIKGIESTVAFKATDNEGRSIQVKGAVSNAQGEEVACFDTFYKGMGLFNLVPDSGTYSVYATYNGKEYHFDLPKILTSGYAISVNNQNPEKMLVQLQKSADGPLEKTGLALMCRGELYYFETIDIDGPSGVLIEVPKSCLPSGVVQLTLVNTRGEVLAERLAFVNHQQQLSIKSHFDKTSYQPYDSVSLSFNVNSPTGKPVETTFSLAVRDRSTEIRINNAGDLLADLLLSSDLKGYVETPAYYFESNDRAHQAALDLLMLTQGWRGYSWKQMTGIDTMAVNYPIEPGLLIDGTVRSIFKNIPKDKVLVKMWMKTIDSLSQKGACLTDKQGFFNFLPEDFIGTAHVSFQTEEAGKRKETHLLLNRVFSPTPKAFSFYDTQVLPDEDLDSLNTVTTMEGKSNAEPVLTAEGSDHKIHLLKEVTVSATKKYASESEGLEHANIVYDVAKAMDLMIDNGGNDCHTLFDFLSAQSAYFQFPSTIHLERDEKIVSPKGWKEGSLALDSNYTYKNRKVVFVINNNRIVDDYQNRELPYLLTMDQIETISISEDPLLWTQYCGDVKTVIPHVVIFIYTNKDGKSRIAPTGVRETTWQGYSLEKEFFHPDYRYGVLPNEKDVRRTLYWNPDVHTDASGKAKIRFYNNGTCQRMTISAETVTQDGTIGVIHE